MYTIPNQPYLRTGDPLNRGLVMGLPMQEPNGPDTRDISGRGNHGTLVNGPTRVMTAMGRASGFDGGGDRYVAATSDGQFNADDLTISMWIHLLSWGQGSFGRLLDMANTEQTEGYTLYVDSSGRVSYASYGPSGTVVSAASLALNQWHHIAVVLTNRAIAGVGSIYVDGVDVTASSSLTTYTPSSNALWFGIRRDLQREFDGYILAPAIHSRVLAPAEIRKLAGLDGDPYVQWRPMPKRRDDDFYGPPINNDIGDSAFLGSVV